MLFFSLISRYSDFLPAISASLIRASSSSRRDSRSMSSISLVSDSGVGLTLTSADAFTELVVLTPSVSVCPYFNC